MSKKARTWILVVLLLITCLGCQTQVALENFTWYDALGKILNLYDDQLDQNGKLETLKDWGFHYNDGELSQALRYKTIHQSFMDYFEVSPIMQEQYDDYVTQVDLDYYLALFNERSSSRQFPSFQQIDYKNPVYYIQKYEMENGILKCDDELEIGMWVAYDAETGMQLAEVVDTKNGYSLVSLGFDEVFDTFKVSDSHDIDLSQSTIQAFGQQHEEEGLFKPVSVQNHTFEYQGYLVSYSIKKDGFKGYVSKKINKLNYYAEFSLSQLKTSYNWDYSFGKIKEAYFVLDYDTQFKVGVAKTNYYDKSILSKWETKNLLPKIIEVFKLEDTLECVIPLANIKVVLPQTLFMDLTLALELHVYASGRVELSLAEDRSMGFEIINNKFRIINDHHKEIDTLFRASANASLGLRASLNAFSYSLMDIGAKVGIKGLFSPIVHLHMDDKVSSSKQAVDIDILEDVNDERISVCADLSLHWFLEVYVNSSRSLAGKLGFDYSKEFLSDQHQLFNNPYTHMEHFMFVPRCTKNNRIVSFQTARPFAEQIELSSYQLLVEKGQKAHIPIKQLPSGLKQSDLEISCHNKSICKVEGEYVVGLKKGQTTLNIQSTSKVHQVQIQVIVE